MSQDVSLSEPSASAPPDCDTVCHFDPLLVCQNSTPRTSLRSNRLPSAKVSCLATRHTRQLLPSSSDLAPRNWTPRCVVLGPCDS